MTQVSSLVNETLLQGERKFPKSLSNEKVYNYALRTNTFDFYNLINDYLIVNLSKLIDTSFKNILVGFDVCRH